MFTDIEYKLTAYLEEIHEAVIYNYSYRSCHLQGIGYGWGTVGVYISYYLIRHGISMKEKIKFTYTGKRNGEYVYQS